MTLADAYILTVVGILLLMLFGSGIAWMIG